MDTRAKDIARDYIIAHLNEADKNINFVVYIVWKSKILHHWKYLISSDIEDGMYYELIYNGIKKEWYLDAYKKTENVIIPEEV